MRPSWSSAAGQQHNGIDAHQLAVVVGVAVAGAGPAGPDAAQHRAGVAADDAVALGLGGRQRRSWARRWRRRSCSFPLMSFPRLRIAARTRSGVAGHAADAHAGRVVDRVEDRRRGRDQRLLADALGAERADRRGILDQDRFDRRHVADRRDQIVVQVLAAAGDELLHQRQAETLRDAALDLAFDQRRVDRAADIVRGDDLQHLDRAEFDVDLDLGQVGAEAVDGVGLALAVGIERRRRRVVGLLRRQHIAASRGHAGEVHRCARPPSRTMTLPSPNRSRASSPALATRRIAARSAFAASCAALPVTKVWREAEVLPQSGVRSVSAETRSMQPTVRRAHRRRSAG